jgi:hypothetical protein
MTNKLTVKVTNAWSITYIALWLHHYSSVILVDGLGSHLQDFPHQLTARDIECSNREEVSCVKSKYIQFFKYPVYR